MCYRVDVRIVCGLQAIAAAIEEDMEEFHGRKCKNEGTADSGWILLDYGDGLWMRTLCAAVWCTCSLSAMQRTLMCGLCVHCASYRERDDSKIPSLLPAGELLEQGRSR